MDRGYRNDFPNNNISPSRDPRLANRPSRPFDTRAPPRDVVRGPKNPVDRRSSTSSVSTDPRDHDAGAKFVQSIGDLTSHIISSVAAIAEQEKVKKRIESTESSLKKAKANENFPSTIAACEQKRKDEDNNLARLEEKLREHKLLRQELEKGVAAFVNASASPQKDPELEEKLRKMQADIERARREADNAQGEALGARSEVEKLKAEKESSKQFKEKMMSLQARIEILEKSMSSYSGSLYNLSKEIKESRGRIEQLTETIAKHTDSAAQEVIFKETQKRFATLEEKISKLTSDLESMSGVRADNQYLAAQLAELKTASEQHQATAEEIHRLEQQLTLLQKSSTSTEALENIANFANALQAKLDDVNKRLLSLEESSRSSHANDARINQRTLEELKLLATKVEALNGLESRLKKLEENAASNQAKQSRLDVQFSKALKSEVDTLRGQLSEMQNLQTVKDDMQFSAVEEVREALEKNKAELEKLRMEHNDISNRLANMQESPSGDIQRLVAGLAQSLEDTKRTIESKQKMVEIGLHSLETRYNNLSTEPIVQHMVVAMQEIYPSPTALMEQLTTLRKQVDKCRDIPMISARLDSVIEGQNTLADQLRNDRISYYAELHRLKEEFAGLADKLRNLWQRYQNEVPRSVQELNEVRGSLIVLLEKFNEHAAKVEQDTKSREEMRQALMSEMSQERDRLNDEIKSLSAEVAEMKSAAADNSKAVDEKIESAKTANADSLLERIRELEESTTGQLQSLIKTLDEMKENTKREISQAISRLENLERLKDTLVRLPLEKPVDLGAARSGSPSVRSSASIVSPTIKNEFSPRLGRHSVITSRESNASEPASAGSDMSPQRSLFERVSSEIPDKKHRRSALFGEEEEAGAGSKPPSFNSATSTSEELRRFGGGGSGGIHSSKKRKKKKLHFSPGEIIALDD